jgi:hypothetical protein
MLGFFALAVSMPGCGGSLASVKGKVTYKGKSPIGATVMVMGSDKVMQMAVVDDQGMYSVTGVKAGTCLFGVNFPNPGQERGGGRGMSTRTNRGQPEEKAAAANWFAIPKKYEIPESAGFSKTLNPGANTFDLELVD